MISVPLDASDCSGQALSFISGFLAHKFKFDFPDLGIKTSEIPWFEPTRFPWLAALSRGGLRQPSDSFFKLIQDYEKVFESVHGDKISLKPNVTKELHKKLMAQFPESESAVALKYSRTRTHIRLRYLNTLLKADQESAKSRESKQLRQFLA